jgi:hypothetical protein
LLEVKVDLIIFLSICILNGESLSIGVCFSWNVSLLSTCSVLFQLPCTNHFVLGVTDVLWSSSAPFLINTDMNRQGDGLIFMTVGRRIEDNLLRTAG